MNILIPVDRYRVDYEVGRGAPFSALDMLVLKAVANDRAAHLEQLAGIMRLPGRLLIEALIFLPLTCHRKPLARRATNDQIHCSF